jgi:uncharacterized protein DUF3467
MTDNQPFVAKPMLTGDEVRKLTEVSEDFYSVFSNHARVAASPTEFRLFFGESYPTATNELRIKELLSIVVTPFQAKAVLGLLSEMIEKFEQSNGTIPVFGVPEPVKSPERGQTKNEQGDPK